MGNKQSNFEKPTSESDQESVINKVRTVCVIILSLFLSLFTLNTTCMYINVNSMYLGQNVT